MARIWFINIQATPLPTTPAVHSKVVDVLLSLYPHFIKKKIGYIVIDHVRPLVRQSVLLVTQTPLSFLTAGVHNCHNDYLWRVDYNKLFKSTNLESKLKVLYTKICLTAPFDFD